MGTTTDQLIQMAHQVSPIPNRRELDMLLTTGERISMSLMSMALFDLRVPAISFTGSQAGVMTDDSSRGETMAAASKLALDFLLRRATMTSRQLLVPNFT
ncbi:hypothetical protein [Bradyrhizobium liaoningense]|uniref:hypothetical protein n=1 Tax=Bradyrhizobium liaoningense TaxID=43992 RepID=UPI002012076E|nr:hypothetical protein [Bradyrhizobium liaoningense]